MSAEWSGARKSANDRAQQALLADLEARYKALEEERNTLLKEKGQQALTLTELRETKQTLETKLSLAETSLATALREASLEKSKVEDATSQEQQKGERVARLEAEGDNLREEISRLTQSNKSLRDQLVEMETKLKLTDSESVPLQFQKERLQKEVETITAHSKWLEGELQSRSQEILSLRASHAQELLKLRKEMDQSGEERDSALGRAQSLERSLKRLRKELDQTSKDLRDYKIDASAVSEKSDQEIASLRSLNLKQKDVLDQLQVRHDQMEKEVEGLRQLASTATRQSEDEMEKMRAELEANAQALLGQQRKEYEKEADRLKKELTAAKSLAPGKGARRSLLENSEAPLGLTDLYTKLAETEDELQAERVEREKLERGMQEILEDIERKTPLLLRQRREYEMGLERQEESRQRLKEAMERLAAVRNEKEEMKLEASRLHKRNREFELETKELAKQVQGLLVSKVGGDIPEGVPTTVEELQSQNHKLLSEHVRLTTTIEDLEDKLRTDPNIAKLSAAEEELEVLRADRERQETMVASIVQQRDMLRVIAGGGSTELVAVDQTAEQLGVLQKRNVSLEEELSNAKAELGKLGTDKMVLEERVSRYSETNKDLQASLDKVTQENVTKEAAVRTSEALVEHHRRTVISLRDELASAQGEIKSRRENLANAHNNIRDLEQQMVAAKAQASRSDYDAREAKSKLRLAETQLQTARAEEQRHATEASQLRRDLNRQGAMIDAVQRIETRLSARGEEEKERLSEENKRVLKLLETERTKVSETRTMLEERTKDWEASMKEAKEKEVSSVNEALAAKKEAMEANHELETLKAKCERIEKELADEKHKATGSAKTSEASKIKSLSQELDAARAELDKAKARVSSFQKIAKSHEDSLRDLTKTSEAFKKTHEDEMASLKGRITSLKKECKAKESVVAELTKDLGNQRGEQDEAVKTLKLEIDGMKKRVATAEKNSSAAVARAESLQAEADKYQKEAGDAQSNYERELNLHASARVDLRTAREAASEADRLRKSAVHEMELAKRETEGKLQAFADEKAGLERSVAELKRRVEDSGKHNETLHTQLAALGEQIEKSQSEKIDSVPTEGGDEEEIGGLRRSVAEYREIVRFLRSERDMDRAQLESAKRTADRERAAAAVTKRSLEEARSELRLAQSRRGQAGDTDKEAVEVKRKEAEAQLTVVTESNQLLRVETAELKKSVSELETKLTDAKNAVAPKDKLVQVLEGKIASMRAEKESLSRDLKSWKGRVQSLVAKFNHVDPEDHKKALADVESMKKERDTAKSDKAAALRTNAALKQQIGKLNKDVTAQQSQIEQQKGLLAKARAETDVAAASSKGSAVVAKERDQLKEKLTKTEAQNKSLATELRGVNDRNEKLKERMRQFQKMLTEKKNTIARLEKEKVATTAASTAAPSTVVPNAPAQVPAPASAKPTDTQTKSEVTKPEQIEKPKDAGPRSNIEPDAKDETPAKVDRQKKPEAQLPAVPKGGFSFGPGPSQTQTETSGKSAVAALKPSIMKRGKPEPPAETEVKSMAPAPSTAAPTESPTQPAAKKPRVAASGSVSPKPGAARVEDPAEQKAKAEQLRAKLLEARMKKKRAMKKKEEEERVVKQAKMENETETEQPTKGGMGSKGGGGGTTEKVAGEKQTEEKQVEPAADAKGSLRATAAPFQPSSKPVFGAAPGTAKSGAVFGSGAPLKFGSSSSVAAHGFGAAKANAPASVFLSDMKPPSASAAPFSFGSAKVENLPMPANPNPPLSSPFGAFQGSNPFGSAPASGGGPKPLFGRSANVKPADKQAPSTEQKEKSTAEKPEIIDVDDDDTPGAS